MDRHNKRWEATATKRLEKPAGASIVKSVGCISCWAAKSIPMTRLCWLPHPAMRAL